MTTYFSLKLIIAALVLLNFWLVITLVETERLLRWYRKKYYAVPRINHAPARRARFIRFIVSFFFTPIPE
jgi:hypothetical protein